MEPTKDQSEYLMTIHQNMLLAVYMAFPFEQPNIEPLNSKMSALRPQKITAT